MGSVIWGKLSPYIFDILTNDLGLLYISVSCISLICATQWSNKNAYAAPMLICLTLVIESCRLAIAVALPPCWQQPLLHRDHSLAILSSTAF